VKEIPFFYYDLFAKIIPGGLAAAALWLLGIRLPSNLQLMFMTSDVLRAVVFPLALLGMAYLLGSYLEAMLRPLLKRVSERTFAAAWQSQRRLLGYPMPPLKSTLQDQISDRIKIWQRLALIEVEQYPAAFSHAHRFQAEGKMFMHTSLPASYFIGRIVWDRLSPFDPLLGYSGAFIAFVSALLFSVYSVWSAERRRWEQTLAAAHQLNFWS
jgi:hypothetical protein